jgi:hypothetical protein
MPGFDLRPINPATGGVGERSLTGSFFAVVDNSTIAFQSVTEAGPGPVALFDLDSGETTELTGLCPSESIGGRPPTCDGGADGIAGDVESLTVTEDGNTLVATVETGGQDFIRQLILVSWDLETLNHTVIPTGSLAFTRAAVLTSGGYLFTPPGDVIDIETGTVQELAPGGVPYSAAVELANGDLLVGTGTGDLVMLAADTWVEEGSPLPAHEAEVLAVAISGDGARAASIGADRFLVVSEVGGEVTDRIRLSDEPTNVAWLDEDRILVTTGEGQAFIIDPSVDLIALARQAVGRSLSDRECQRYLGTSSCAEWGSQP